VPTLTRLLEIGQNVYTKLIAVPSVSQISKWTTNFESFANSRAQQKKKRAFVINSRSRIWREFKFRNFQSVSRAQSRQERADVINSQWVPLIGANTRAIDFEGYCNSDDAADANFQEFHSSTCSVYILSNAISQQYPAPSHAGGKQTKFRRLFFPCAIFLTSMMNS
jgi:hypothetical protein